MSGLFKLTKPQEGLLVAEYDNPPYNMLTDRSLDELEEIVELLELSDSLRVFVLKSANPDFFIARYDLNNTGNMDPIMRLKRFATVTTRLSRASVISIAAIRGRARGGRK